MICRTTFNVSDLSLYMVSGTVAASFQTLLFSTGWWRPDRLARSSAPHRRIIGFRGPCTSGPEPSVYRN